MRPSLFAPAAPDRPARVARFLSAALLAVAALRPAPAAAEMPMESATAAPSLTAEAVQQLLTQAEQATDLDAETRLKVVERYKAAYRELKRLDELRASAAKAEQDARTAAERANGFRGELERLGRTLPFTVPASRPLAETEADLATRTANLSALKATLKEIEAERKKRPDRQTEIRKEQTQADVRRAEMKLAAEAVPPDGEPAALTLARQAEAEAKRLTFEQSLAGLNFELARYTAEEAIDLLGLREKVAKAKVAREEAAVKVLTAEINRRRRDDAERQIREAHRQELLVHPLLKPLAERNRFDAEEVRRLSTKVEAVERELDQAADEVETQRRQFEQSREKVAMIGLTRPIGLMLRAQRSEFPDLRERERHQEARQELIDEARLLWWDNAERLKTLPSPTELVRAASIDARLSPEERADLERAAADVLETSRTVLTELERSSKRYFDRLVELDSVDRQYLNESGRYLTYINERILWTRSAEPLTVAAVRADSTAQAWLFSPDRWRSVAAALAADPYENPLAFWPTLAAVIALFYVRYRIRPRLRELGEQAGRRAFLRYGPTWQAALMTVMSAVTVPAALMFLSWRLAEGAELTGFVRSVAVVLQWCAAFLFPIDLLRETCRPLGLAEAHFAWPTRVIRALRRLMGWLKIVGVPVLFAAGLAHQHAPLAGGTAIERLLFASGMLAAALAAHRALGARSDLARALVTQAPQGSFARFRPVWYWGALAVPLLLAGLSLVGYHYSATQLADRLLKTLWLMPALAIARALATRWVLLGRRRLLLDQAYQRRAAEEASDPTAPPRPVAADETDVAKSTEQTRKLINIVLLGVAASGLGTVWFDVLPAFHLLDRTVWYASADGVAGSAASPTVAPGVLPPAPGESSASPAPHDAGSLPVTTLDLLIAGLVAAFTFLASRNLPGLMEMSVLNRLPVDNATRYAATRLASYAIVIVGVLFASNNLGLRWQNVQWLAAALTVGLGFGLQEVFANFVSGLIILFERPVRVGDVVTIGEVTGVVSRIRMRATTITNWDRKEFIVPNKEFITGRLLNWTLSDAVNRVTIEVGVAYGTDTDQARAILLRICDEQPLLLKDPAPNATFEGFGDSMLRLVLRCFLPSLDKRLDVIHELHTRIDREFRHAGIEIAFPQRDLRIRSVDAAAIPLFAGGPSKPPEDAGLTPVPHRAAG